MRESASPWSSQTRTPAESEAARVMQVCNACRYCEGFCAVFPAMTRRVDFLRDDLHYLANLCHNCGACLHSCQYAPPHEFAINVPQTMARVRVQTYAEYAWPSPLGKLYRSNGFTVAAAVAVGIALFLLLAVDLRGSLRISGTAGNFYTVFSHTTLAVMFGLVFGFAVLALSLGVMRFWQGVGGAAAQPGGAVEALRAALTLKYLDGGHGAGCNDEDDTFTLRRRRFHHFTFYGFMLCFSATVVATVEHYAFGWHAPYPALSLPVLLGTAGGIGLLIGPAGLLWLNLRRPPEHGDKRQQPIDLAFIALLLATSITGLILLAGRTLAWMPALLALHLGFVTALFVTLPYGKFAHGVYRSAALLKYSFERRAPSTVKFGGD